jgi:glycerophosphoryl diester phosphodiesterase
MGIGIVGHRGAAGVAPENTLPSFEAAWAVEVDWVETDVRLTRDGVPVLLHDATLERTTTGTGTVVGLRWEELQEVDAGIRFGPSFAGTRVPRLEELLATAAGRSGILIELKAEKERPELLVERVVAAVAAGDASSWVRLISFEADLLERVRQVEPEWATGFIASEAAGLLETALRLACVAIHPRLTALSSELVEAAHTAGLQVNAWTANTPEHVSHAAALGVDEITTDFPEVGRRALGQYG